MMEQVKPHQIYAAGDLSDPHGTHRICWEAIREALASLKDEPWFAKIVMYGSIAGCGSMWDMSDVDMAVPLSPGERMKKRRAIFKHASQKDQPKYPGTNSREFWMIADEQTMRTARLYDQLGMAEYDAIEGFMRWTTEDQQKL
jgi:glucosamine-6-phosphate deaminase